MNVFACSVTLIIRSSTAKFQEMIHSSMRLIKKLFLAFVTCLFSLGGAVAGCVAGGVIGCITESGIAGGCGMGVVSGVIVALELFDSLIDGRFMSKVTLFGTSLINGKVFVDWVCPAMLKAYQSQAFTVSILDNDDMDLYSLDDGPRGLAPKLIEKLPSLQFQQCRHIRCTICLEEFKDGENGRKLGSCGHCFHTGCIDAWLTLRASCPVCRQLVSPTGNS
ncbi:hypothetical protein QQ045_008454 [Rhodiola kirilowii]